MTVRHPSRRRSVIALVILAAVVIAMVVVVARAWPRADPAPQPVPSPTAPLGAAPTMLVQLRDDALSNVDNVFMALDAGGGAGTGAQMYVPQNLVVDLAGGQDEILGVTGIKPISQAPALLTAQTGWRVDSAFVLDRLAYAGLVDAVGGVEVEVAAPLVVRDRFGKVTTTIPAGTQLLDGPEAALYAMYLEPGAPESDRVARFRQTWEGVLAGLPAEADRIRAIFGSLGALARSTQPVTVLAEFFAEAGAAQRAGALSSSDLAVAAAAAGPVQVAWIDPAAAALQSAMIFPAAVRPVAEPPLRVRVYRAGATAAEVEKVRGALTGSGATFVWAGQAPDQSTTTVTFAAAEVQEQLAAAVLKLAPSPTPTPSVSVPAGASAGASAGAGASDAASAAAAPSGAVTPPVPSPTASPSAAPVEVGVNPFGTPGAAATVRLAPARAAAPGPSPSAAGAASTGAAPASATPDPATP